MSRAIFQELDVMTSAPRATNKNQPNGSQTPQQNADRQDRLAKALRENLLKRKEQMRARLKKLEESVEP